MSCPCHVMSLIFLCSSYRSSRTPPDRQRSYWGTWVHSTAACRRGLLNVGGSVLRSFNPGRCDPTADYRKITIWASLRPRRHSICEPPSSPSVLVSIIWVRYVSYFIFLNECCASATSCLLIYFFHKCCAPALSAMSCLSLYLFK